MPIEIDNTNIIINDGITSNVYEVIKSKGEKYSREYNYSQQPVTLDETIKPQIPADNYQYHILTFEGTSGYTSTTDGNQRTYNINFPEDVVADILVVGGGGAGAGTGGGGAGALIYVESVELNGSYNINVGRGGIPQSNVYGSYLQGKTTNITQNSTILYQAVGGGGGGGWSNPESFHASSGGSGGGAAAGYTIDSIGGGLSSDNIINGISVGISNSTYVNTGYTGDRGLNSVNDTGCFGNKGGNEYNPEEPLRIGAGGGGAGSVGYDVPISTTLAKGGNGGSGKFYDIDGISKPYAAGGGGGMSNDPTLDNTTPTKEEGFGGSGIGGDGRAGDNINGYPGAPNTGSGGGGGGGGTGIGGNGGSGIVIIRYYVASSITHKYLAFTHQQYPKIDADDTNLKLHLKFDDSYNSSTPNNVNLSLISGTISYVDGLIGKSARPNNARLRIINPSQIITEGETEISITFWVNNLTSSNGYQYITRYLQGNIFVLYNYPSDATYQQIAIGVEGKSIWYNVGDITQWTHIAFTCKQDDYNLYINGINVNSSANSIQGTTNLDTGFTHENDVWEIFNIATGGTYTKGDFEDFRIYNKALTQSEINTLYNVANYTTYTLNVPENTICDILIVGGGGGGGPGHGGGGGAGQLVYINQATLNGTYNVKVGKGGIGGISTEVSGTRQATKGSDSSFDIVIAEGGGANTNTLSDKNGGSGAGGDGYTPDGGTEGKGLKNANVDTFSSGSVYAFGNDGGIQSDATKRIAGGGGGAGAPGLDGTSNGYGGIGLSGISSLSIDFKTHFGLPTNDTIGDYDSISNKVYFAGGGGGGHTPISDNSSLGGGGKGGINTHVNPGFNGLANSGGGGGGGSGGAGQGGDGGSGIVIIRFPYIKNYDLISYDAQWTYNSENTSVYHLGNVGININADTSNSLTIAGDVNINGDIYINNAKFNYSNTIIENEQVFISNDYIEELTGMSGWTKIKHRPANDGTWFAGDTFSSTTINSSYTYGSPTNDNSQWAVAFDHTKVKYYLFIERTGLIHPDYYDRWFVFTADNMDNYVNYPDWIPAYKATGYPNGYANGLQYNRGGTHTYDPNIGPGFPHTKISDGSTTTTLYTTGRAIYLEASTINWNGPPPTITEVYVKYTDDIPLVTPQPQIPSNNYQYITLTYENEHPDYTSTTDGNQRTYNIDFSENVVADILVVGGGGGGGGSIGGGGGGGSVIYATGIDVPANTYTIKVGKGGSGGINQVDGTNGKNSEAFGAIAVGGGRGGDFNISGSRASGGSGGGTGGGANNNQGVGIALAGNKTISSSSLLYSNYSYYTNDGGDTLWQEHPTYETTGGGGGGAGTKGSSFNGVSYGGSQVNSEYIGLGGDGEPISITGVSVYYGAGGGGGSHKGNLSEFLGKPGGLGGGGNGGNEFSTGIKTDGTNGTGYGAGGGGGAYQKSGGNGGSGIVIIRYYYVSSITHKYLALTYQPVEDLVYDFTDYNTETEWKAKAATIPNFTYSFDTWFKNPNDGSSIGGVDGMWTAGSAIGYIQYTLPSGYNKVTINYGNINTGSYVRVLINGVEKSSAGANTFLSYTQNYNTGDILKIEEGLAIMSANLIITLENTTQPTQKTYTLNVIEDTTCDVLVINNTQAYKATGVTLNGSYNVIVGSDSKIQQNGTDLYVPDSGLSITDSITGESIQYTANNPIVIIRYKINNYKLKGLSWNYSNQFDDVYYMNKVSINKYNATSQLDINGDIVGTSKSFKIIHPISKNIYLYHACIEGPRFDNIYRGKKLVINGYCEVDIDSECNSTGGMTPGTFVALNDNCQLYLQNNQTFDKVRGYIENGIIKIYCINTTENIMVDWLVIGERKDNDVIKSSFTNASGKLICEH